MHKIDKTKTKQKDHISTVTVPLEGGENSIEKSQSLLPFPVFFPPQIKSSIIILVSSP